MTPADLIAIERAAKYANGLDPGPHPHLKEEQLSYETKVLIGKHVFALLDERDRRRSAKESGGDLDDSFLYLAAIEHFGMDCPHQIIAFNPMRCHCATITRSVGEKK
jgi:hypothetical protein